MWVFQQKKYDNQFLWLIFVLFLLINTPVLWLNNTPEVDVITRYAPMAEAFAHGQWQQAFHPRFGVLFPTLTGSVCWVSSLDGFRSCQMVSLLFFIVVIFPLFGLLKQVYDRETAWIGVILYLFSSHLLRFAFEGIRDGGKSLGFVLIAYSLISLWQQERWWKHVLNFAIGGGLLTLLKGDGAFTVLLFAILSLSLEIWRIQKFPWRTLVACFTILIAISPQLWYNYELLGYPVPECRHAQVLKRAGIAPFKTPQVEVP